jgi:integrase
MYMQALRDFKYKVELLPIDAIGQDAVDWVQNWLEEEQEWDFEGKIIAKVAYSNCSFNKVVQRLSCFHRWIIRELKLNIPNLWDKYGADRKPQVTDIKTVDLDDFYSMLKHVTKEKGWTIIAGYKRNVFQPWLKAAFQFGLYTGGRRAVLANVRWCDVKYDKKGNPSYLLVEKIKENKAKGFVKQTEKLTYPFILTHELLELLEELGLHNNKGKEEFIFAPEIMERKFIMQCLTRGFTHFYSLLNNGEHLTFKHLRKTFITDMELARIEGRIESVEEATGHAKNTRVLKKNYIDTRTIAAKLKGRRMVKKVA